MKRIVSNSPILGLFGIIIFLFGIGLGALADRMTLKLYDQPPEQVRGVYVLKHRGALGYVPASIQIQERRRGSWDSIFGANVQWIEQTAETNHASNWSYVLQESWTYKGQDFVSDYSYFAFPEGLENWPEIITIPSSNNSNSATKAPPDPGVP